MVRPVRYGKVLANISQTIADYILIVQNMCVGYRQLFAVGKPCSVGTTDEILCIMYEIIPN